MAASPTSFYTTSIVDTSAGLLSLKLENHKMLAADVETNGTDPLYGTLLGVAVAPLSGRFANGSDAAYVIVPCKDTGALSYLSDQLARAKLVGHNHAYDKSWLDTKLKIDTYWHADTRLMWHMSERPVGPKGYGLKEAQTEVLGWGARGDEELERQVTERGGSLKKGDHYLADPEVLGRYAGLDVISTALLYYRCRKAHFDEYPDQWELLGLYVKYSQLLYSNTVHGIRANKQKLEDNISRLKQELRAGRHELAAHLEPSVRALVERWHADDVASYKTERGRLSFLGNPDAWRTFNLSSDKQKRELFYGEMKLPVLDTVKPRKDKTTGRKIYSDTPSTSFDSITKSIRMSQRLELVPVLNAYETSEHAETMLNNFAVPWLGALRATKNEHRIHPPFNPSGTVSFRISGFKPYFLNLPFEERELMSCFSCDEGYGGVTADLVSVEPAVTAHYSQDPHLEKVFGRGLGDVYLDLALTLFPEDAALRKGYDPNAVIVPGVKDSFKQQRKVAKIVQLAVQYTGTGRTVSASLTKAGFPTTYNEAEDLVTKYWIHFAAVGKMNDALRALHSRRGYLKNVIGQIIKVPSSCDKDVPNRFIQSSGHGILMLWVMKTFELCKERGIEVKPLLIDLHDSTSLQAPLGQVPMLRRALKDALTDTNKLINMTVDVRAEVKEFNTLAGLKGDGL